MITLIKAITIVIYVLYIDILLSLLSFLLILIMTFQLTFVLWRFGCDGVETIKSEEFYPFSVDWLEHWLGTGSPRDVQKVPREEWIWEVPYTLLTNYQGWMV